MLVYISQNGEKQFEDYDRPEEKDKIMSIFRAKAKKEMRDNDYTEMRYAVIDFHNNESTVFIMTREVTEKFSITGY